MSLKKLFKLQNEGPERIPTLPVRKKAGMGPLSNGVPQKLPYGGRGGDGPKLAPTEQPGEPIETGIEPDAMDQTIPMGRQNPGGAGAPPQSAGAFSRPPNAPQEEPLPDLPLESKLKRAFGLQRTEVKLPRRSGKLVELYTISEMPRPAGSYGKPVMAMLQWAKDQGGREFTAKDLFRIWRQAGGQPNQGDDKKAYASFQTSVRQFIDARGRGTPEAPLVVVQQGVRGRGGAAIYRWGAARPSQVSKGSSTAQSGAFDDMDLGPAGAAHTLAQQPSVADAEEEMPEMEPNPGNEPEPEEPEAEEEPSDEDEFDWVPEPSEDTQVGRAMLSLQEQDPEKLQDLLISVQDSKTVLDACSKAIGMFGRGTVQGRNAILIAKAAAANLGLPDPDEVL